MDELRILIARLGWPSTSARWWTMQELAARLGASQSRDETESALLQLLRSRRLEAEVVEILCIIWMAVQANGYSPAEGLAKSVQHSSILSDLLLESLGLVAEVGGKDLVNVPRGFEAPEDFHGIQGSSLSRIFRTSLELLERHTGLPFVLQMAFEWSESRAIYPEAPLQADPGHFLRPLGDGFVGQLSSRAALRGISAYLRTLAVAQKFWTMPRPRATQEAMLALPVHPTLAFLKPQRPDWFPQSTDFDGSREQIDVSVRAMLEGMRASRPDDELIAFTSPVYVSMERCVEVSIVRWAQAAGGKVADAELAAHLEYFWRQGKMRASFARESMSTTTVLSATTHAKIMDDDCMAWPLAAPLNLDRLGYLQQDLYPSRLFLPTNPGSGDADVIPCDGQLEVRIAGQAIADLCYWNAGWSVARPMQFRGNCGTALISRGADYRDRDALARRTERSFYLWQVRTLHRDNAFDQFSQALTVGISFV